MIDLPTSAITERMIRVSVAVASTYDRMRPSLTTVAGIPPLTRCTSRGYAGNPLHRLARWILPLLTLAPAFAGCRPPDQEPAALHVEWAPLETFNDGLPAGLRVYEGRDPAIPIRAWYVRIAARADHVTTRVVRSNDISDNRETPSEFARDFGACVVVNGGYFSADETPARHAGLLLIGDTLIAAPTRSVLRDSVRYETARAALGFTADGRADISWVSTRGDTLYAWSRPPDHQPGLPAGPLDYEKASPWNVFDAVGAGPALLRDGKVNVTSDQEVFFGSSITEVHPRTAAGITADGSLILMVVDGRQPESRGASLEELAALLRDTGAVQGLNLDGGGSSALVVNGALVNRPTGGGLQREVMSALAIFCR